MSIRNNWIVQAIDRIVDSPAERIGINLFIFLIAIEVLSLWQVGAVLFVVFVTDYLTPEEDDKEECSLTPCRCEGGTVVLNCCNSNPHSMDTA